MKKLPIILLSILIAAFINNSGAQQKAFADESAKTYWTIPELLEFKKTADLAMETECADNYRCKEEFYYNHADEDARYIALEMFTWHKFMLTAINPAAETFRVFYINEDRNMAQLSSHYQAPGLAEFFLAWVSESLPGNPASDFRWLAYNEHYPTHLASNGDIISATHIMVDENEETQGDNWFTPNTEIEYSAAGHDIIENTRHILYFSIKETNNGRSMGSLDYRSCFEPDRGYQDGMECRIVFHSDGSTSYYPFSTKPVNNDIQEETSVDTSENEGDNPTTTVTTTTNTNFVKTPNTGEFTLPAEEKKTVEFPWWLGAIIGLNVLVLIWLFLPIGVEKPKKSKKGIDKIKRLR